jgi:hypothetical protein
VIKQVQAKLEEAEIAAISTVDDGAPARDVSLNTEVDDPDVSQAGRNEDPG